jgi:glycosidase
VVHTPERQATYAARLDGALDFMLAKALRNTFGRARWDLAEFESFLGAHEAYFPASFSRPAFLDNHDMNRFLHLAGDDTSALMLAALALFTLSGPPIVYYGTEVGVTQERPVHDGSVGRFEEARLPMKWGSEQNEQLREHFRRLLGLRLNYPVLATGLRRVLHLDPHAGTYAYLRAANPARYTPGDALIAINAGAEPANLEVLYAGPESASDHLAGHTTTVESGQLRLRLPPRSGAFIA